MVAREPAPRLDRVEVDGPDLAGPEPERHARDRLDVLQDHALDAAVALVLLGLEDQDRLAGAEHLLDHARGQRADAGHALPLFEQSEYRYVGYANTLVRPPEELYALLPFGRYDGADLIVQRELGETFVEVQLMLGESREELADGIRIDADAARGVNVSVERGPVRLRASYLANDVTVRAPGVTPLVTALESLPPVFPGLEATLDALSEERRRVGYVAFGLRLDLDPFVVEAEYARRSLAPEFAIVPDARGWYVSLSRRFGRVTPYGFLASFDEEKVDLPLVLPAGVPELEALRRLGRRGAAAARSGRGGARRALGRRAERRAEAAGGADPARDAGRRLRARFLRTDGPRHRRDAPVRHARLRVLTEDASMIAPTSRAAPVPGRPRLAAPSRAGPVRAALTLLVVIAHGAPSSAEGELVADGGSSGEAPVQVVANASAGFERLSAREVRKLFMGKSRRLPDGGRAVLAGHEPSASDFNALALGRSNAEVGAAWARLRFAGRTRPPREFDSVAALLAFVAATPNAVAWVPAALPAGAAPDGVATVFRAP